MSGHLHIPQQQQPQTRLTLSVQSSLVRLFPDLAIKNDQSPTTCSTEDDISRRALAASGLNVSAPEFVPSFAAPSPTTTLKKPHPKPQLTMTAPTKQATFVMPPPPLVPPQNEHPLSPPDAYTYTLSAPSSLPNPAVYSNVTEHLSPLSSHSPSSSPAITYDRVTNSISSDHVPLSSSVSTTSIPQRHFDIHFPALSTSNSSSDRTTDALLSTSPDNSKIKNLNKDTASWLSCEDDQQDQRIETTETDDWRTSNITNNQDNTNDHDLPTARPPVRRYRNHTQQQQQPSPHRYYNNHHHQSNNTSSRRVVQSFSFHSHTNSQQQNNHRYGSYVDDDQGGDISNGHTSSSPSFSRRRRGGSSTRGGGRPSGRGGRGGNRGWGCNRERERESHHSTNVAGGPTSMFESTSRQQDSRDVVASKRIGWSSSSASSRDNDRVTMAAETTVDGMFDVNGGGSMGRRRGGGGGGGSAAISSSHSHSSGLRAGVRRSTYES